MEGIFLITVRSNLSLDPCICNTFNVIPAEDEEQDQDWDSVEHSADER